MLKKTYIIKLRGIKDNPDREIKVVGVNSDLEALKVCKKYHNNPVIGWQLINIQI